MPASYTPFSALFLAFDLTPQCGQTGVPAHLTRSKCSIHASWSGKSSITSMRFMKKTPLCFKRSCFNSSIFGIIATVCPEAAPLWMEREIAISLFNCNYYTIFTELKQAKNPCIYWVYRTFSTNFFNPKTTYCVFFFKKT